MSSENLSQRLRALEEKRQLAEKFVQYQRKRKRKPNVCYRCRVKGCLLLWVTTVSEGGELEIVCYQPGYKLSVDKNSEFSTEAGRRANTKDGDRHWKAQTFFLRQAAGALHLACDHIQVQVAVEQVERHARQRRGEVKLPDPEVPAPDLTENRILPIE